MPSAGSGSCCFNSSARTTGEGVHDGANLPKVPERASVVVMGKRGVFGMRGGSIITEGASRNKEHTIVRIPRRIEPVSMSSN